MSQKQFEEAEDVENDEVIGVALRWSLIAVVAITVLGLGAWGLTRFWGQEEPEVVETEITLPKKRELATFEKPMVPLTDITSQSGIDWVHVSGMEGEKLLPETMGGGVAVLDFDNDDDPDLLFVGGTSWPWAKQPVSNPRSLCLFRNDGAAGFTDVTDECGLTGNFYGMAPCVGDVDNDGWPDLFVSAVGSNRFYHNQDGKFVDQSEASGLAGKDDAWGSGAAWFDYDRDGLLDLFVCDYVVWNRDLDQSLGFKLTGVGRAFGQPTLFTGTNSHLYHNLGDAKFEDVSEAMGIQVDNPNTGVPVGKGLAVATLDVDADGWQDIVVANDTVQNFLFLNLDGQEFEEVGVPMGIAFDRSGNATGAMGIDCSYLRNDESLAIAIGNFANEQSSLFMAKDPLTPFNDQAMVTGLGPLSRLNLTFGMCFADLDLDGRQDLFCSNGHLEEEISKVQSSQNYKQPPQFFWNAGRGGASELVPLLEEQVGPAALEPMVGRGTAYADLDSDGDLDVILVANSGAPRVLRNDQTLENNWVQLELKGTRSNRDAIGAIATVVTANTRQRRVVQSTRSYLSQCDARLTFGLGASSTVDAVTVQWPSGSFESFSVTANQLNQLVEGSGTSVESP